MKSWTGTSALSMTRNWRSAVSRLTSDAEASPSRRAPDTEELKRRYNAMGKRKEIKFLCKDGQTREGRQDGVMFWIRKDQKREQDGLPAFYVAANDIKGKGRTIYTAGHEYFTLEGAKELLPADHGRRGQPGGTKSQIRGGGHRKKNGGRLRLPPSKPRLSGTSWRPPGSPITN